MINKGEPDKTYVHRIRFFEPAEDKTETPYKAEQPLNSFASPVQCRSYSQGSRGWISREREEEI